MNQPGPANAPTPDGLPAKGPAPTESDPTIYRVRAGEFEGPMDLLLHLVRINEVDITAIPIAEITRQYNDYLDWMRELNLEIAGEFLVMAATLMHIKSRMLLPPDPVASEDSAPEDPRAELAQQLLEYQRFKQAAETLHALDAVRGLVWTRDGKVPSEFEGEELLEVGLFDLIAAFRKLVQRLGEDARLQLRRDDVSVADKIGWLTDLLEQRHSLELLDLLAGQENRIEQIATFLAVLELMRLGRLVAFQRMLMGEIRIVLRTDPQGLGGMLPEAGS